MGKVSKKCKLETESAVFNVLNPRELAMYEYVNQQTNKSGYLKHLVEMDMMGALRFTPIMQDSIDKTFTTKQAQKPEELLDLWMED